MPEKQPFGLWSSPISASLLAMRKRLMDVRWDSDGETLIVVEGRSDRGVLVAYPIDDAARELSGDLSVRGGVGYGGGEFSIVRGVVVFCERGGRLFRRSLGFDPTRPLTPAFGSVASPAISPDGEWVVYVYSDGETDLLGLVDAAGQEWPVKLVHGADFYMQPAWHPDGERLAWIEWNHPHMPWHETRLMMGRVEGRPPRIDDVTLVAGGQAGTFVEPQFSPDGRWLSYIDASGEWDSLVLVDLASGAKQTLVAGDQFHLTEPAWVQGERSYGWSYDSRRIFATRNFGGRASLFAVEVASGQETPIDTGPYTWLKQVSVSPVRDEIALIASSPRIPDRVVRWDGTQWKVVARSDAEITDPAYFSEPQPITWKGNDGQVVYGLYSPPANPDYSADGLPPAIVYIHGGPTSATPVHFAADAAYFTSRGYGWLDVNYRGSTGYGRTYQQALDARWGDLDVEDAASGARALAEQGLADSRRLVIMGGSAGGYTVLNALIRYPGLFKAGVNRFGVSNLFTIGPEGHKFEVHYQDRLIGVLPEASQRYYDWSPVFHAERIRDALAVFQGAEDTAVPPSQSEEIVAALKANGVPHMYRLYEGEGHGFRKIETIRDYLNQVERFLQQYVLFAP